VLCYSCTCHAHGDTTRPQFAANLGFLFQEVDLLARYNATAGAGFRGVETPFPYSVPPEALAARLQSCGLAQVLSNLPPGNWDAGERGFGALPGREEAFAESLEQAVTYAQALSCTRLHAMAGSSPAGASRTSCEAVFIRNLRWAAETLRPQETIELVAQERIQPMVDRVFPFAEVEAAFGVLRQGRSLGRNVLAI
jgi:hydroxypyruvate isomerase